MGTFFFPSFFSFFFFFLLILPPSADDRLVADDATDRADASAPESCSPRTVSSSRSRAYSGPSTFPSTWTPRPARRRCTTPSPTRTASIRSRSRSAAASPCDPVGSRRRSRERRDLAKISSRGTIRTRQHAVPIAFSFSFYSLYFFFFSFLCFLSFVQVGISDDFYGWVVYLFFSSFFFHLSIQHFFLILFLFSPLRHLSVYFYRGFIGCSPLCLTGSVGSTFSRRYG